MDSDGQHEEISLCINYYLLKSNNDLIIGSRFAKGSSIEGLQNRKKGSSFANYLLDSLPKKIESPFRFHEWLLRI